MHLQWYYRTKTNHQNLPVATRSTAYNGFVTGSQGPGCATMDLTTQNKSTNRHLFKTSKTSEIGPVVFENGRSEVDNDNN